MTVRKEFFKAKHFSTMILYKRTFHAAFGSNRRIKNRKSTASVQGKVHVCVKFYFIFVECTYAYTLGTKKFKIDTVFYITILYR